MMKSVEDLAQEIVVREGGLVNDPDDPGGATNHGVTIGTLRRLGIDVNRDTRIDVADVRALTRAQAVDIYVEHYFTRPGIGGLVAEGSVVRGEGTLVSFVVTDTNESVPVRYTGLLPDLFKEGTGMIALGQMQDGTFVATEVLAKHDETYMPKEVTEALKEQGVYQGPDS